MNIQFKSLIPRRSPFVTTTLPGQYSRYLSTATRSGPAAAEAPNVTTYSGTSRPRPYHLKHPPPALKRDLPRLQRSWPTIVAFAVVGVAGWTVFLTYVTNQEKISSSVVKQIMRELREDEALRAVLGDAIRMQGEWWLNGDPRIIGSVCIVVTLSTSRTLSTFFLQISTMQGTIDVSFRVKGSKGAHTTITLSNKRWLTPYIGAGTVYFTSIRREKGVPFETLRFKVIADDGSIISKANDATS
ncbi:cytochrome oxidase complex assembly protein 1-domain-containing protein [Lentinula aciculospora]|uniref:Cytochrome oxidase complex assembly protein 1-domain-containing protein n=1 Tax=Lentinula aciculospora TaxID=153920 RepID=A0A9W9DGT2_9AGAR|nr:cytochrome oxidase complex assembly protein 1-domain-containing protein [Lentinula aciculospora]